MSAKSLFNIVLKLLGIYFFKDVLISLPTIFGSLYGFGMGEAGAALSVLAISLLTILIFCVAAYFLVFRTEWVIGKLRLAEAVPEDPIPLNIHRSTVVSIAVLLVALYLIADAIPQIVRSGAEWVEYRQLTRGLFGGGRSFNYTVMLQQASQIVTGCLMIGYHRSLVNFIELKTRRQKR